MAVQAIIPAAHPAESTEVQTGMTTLASTGAGNGFQFDYKDGYLCVIHNDTGGLATITIKSAQPTLYSDKSIVIPDESATPATTETHTWKPDSVFKDVNGKVTIECDVLVKMKVFTQITRS